MKKTIAFIRKATHKDVSQIARCHVDTWRTTYRTMLPCEYLANLTYEDRAVVWSELLRPTQDRRTAVFVAELLSEEVVGVASCQRERSGKSVFCGELTAIYVLDAHQRKGIGYQLIRSVAKDLQDSGMDSMLAWVLIDNPACRFYERLGGVLVQRKEIHIGGMALEEVAYGWDELDSVTR